MPRGHSLSIYAPFSSKKSTSMYISREKGDHYYIQTRHNDRFSHYNLFLGKSKENWPEKCAWILLRVYRILLMPPGHPIILLKSNYFNMAAASEKSLLTTVRLGTKPAMWYSVGGDTNWVEQLLLIMIDELCPDSVGRRGRLTSCERPM